MKLLITKELNKLRLPKNGELWNLMFEQAMEVSKIMTPKEMKEYIREYYESLPIDLYNNQGE